MGAKEDPSNQRPSFWQGLRRGKKAQWFTPDARSDSAAHVQSNVERPFADETAADK
jgi:hypothetical protein